MPALLQRRARRTAVANLDEFANDDSSNPPSPHPPAGSWAGMLEEPSSVSQPQDVAAPAQQQRDEARQSRLLDDRYSAAV